MTKHRRKRSRREYEADNEHHSVGVAQTLAHLKKSSGSPNSVEKDEATVISSQDGSEEWQKVDRHSSKKRKKDSASGNYPSISHTSHARLQSFVKIGDLQNLVLYLLADGTAPQWCAVKHHANVRKVVTLMVPGLEAGMFDKTIPLSESEKTGPVQATQTNGHAADEDNAKVGLTNGESSEPKNIQLASSIRHMKSGKLNVTPDDYYPDRLKSDRLPDALKPMSDMFEHIWPIKTPGDDKYAKMHSPVAAMLTAPIVKTKEEKRSKGPQPPREGKRWKNQRTPITEFVATTGELTEEGYVLHPAHYNGTTSEQLETAKRGANKTTSADGWVDTPNIASLTSGEIPDIDVEAGSTLAGRTVLAMDCEMCITSPVGIMPQIFSLTRISLVDWDGNVVLDEFVKPDEPITNYLTPYSGITAAKLENVTTSLQDVQKKLISEILTPQTILVGHSLDADLKALKLTHPYIVDTALLFPHPRGPPLKSSLKWLAQKYLSREIQKGHGVTGHDSIEDAKACLDLVKQKCEKGKLWGTSEASGESIFKRLDRQIRAKRDMINPVGDNEHRTGALVDWGDSARVYGGPAKVAIGCESDEQIVAGVKRALFGDDDEAVVPKGGVDFVFARLRELEAYRGWWNRSKNHDNETLVANTTTDSNRSSLSDATAKTVQHVQEIWQSLPPCTALIVYSGSGDPRELTEMQDRQKLFKEEYRVKKWDQLSVKWTDTEEQKLRHACEKARMGVGFVTVK